jgi:tRNA-2-methylthio-N6-dimethylallyladenosine synthase
LLNIKKVYIKTFGCRQNFADSERILGVLGGFTPTDDIHSADLIVFNTCAVRETAEKKAFGLIGELSHIKAENPDVIIAVGGCMAQIAENAEKIRRSYKQVDIVFGTNALHILPELISKAEASRQCRGAQCAPAVSQNAPAVSQNAALRERDVLREPGVLRERNALPYKQSGFLADIPIMYGCDNFCSYCIVPYVRGRERSRAPSEILSDIKAAVQGGAREIMLLGQNVNSYGKGLSPEITFAELLHAVNEIDGDFRIRFMSPHPKDMTEDVINAIADSTKICKSIHLPLQSGSDRILAAMNRKYDRARYLEIVETARRKMPGLSISTDIIVGFPNETEEDFEDTLDIVRQVGFSNIFTFIYSKRGGTKAAEMIDNTPYTEKQARMKRLLSLQRETSTELYKTYIGNELSVLFDEKSKREGYLTGKSDEFIIVEAAGEKNLIGQIKKVKITKAHNWALEGEIIENGE